MDNYIYLRGSKFSLSDLSQIETQSEFEEEAIGFIEDWVSGKETFDQYTSGSTGNPKLIQLSRSQMMASAFSTIKALKLKPNTNSLLCINPKYIGGKMVIVRSLLNKMDLILKEPSSSPLSQTIPQIDFAAMTPHQMTTVLESRESYLVNNISTIILGGAPIPISLNVKLQQIESNIYSTYGMTETSSHIALKKLNGSERSNYFTALDEIELNIDDRECLTIKGAVTNFETIVTNDRVNLISDKQFEWLGRVDNVINSGGIKIQSEKVEQLVEKILIENGFDNRIFVSGMPDEKLGEKVTLFVEGKIKDLSDLKKQFESRLNKFEKPREIIGLEKFVETASGKVDKTATRSSL